MSKDSKLLPTLHVALMPDYNRAAAVYWWSLIVVGALVIGMAIHEASLRPLQSQFQILAVCIASARIRRPVVPYAPYNIQGERSVVFIAATVVPCTAR